MFRGLFVVLSLFVFLVNAKNYEWGTRDPKDRLLAREFAYKSPFFLLRVDAEVVYNPYRLSRSLKGNASEEVSNKDAKIGYIKIIDEVSSENGSDADITAGGIGKGYARIHFESQRSKRIDSVVEFYGH